jgi:hypothetical protein
MKLNHKIAWNITFHWQLPQLKWHLDNIFLWNSCDDSEYVFVTSHKENLESILDWVKLNHPKKLDHIHSIHIPKDEGNHLGCTRNNVEGLKYIRDNIEFDYVANVEADNQFRDEGKFVKLVNELHENKKDMLLVDHDAIFGALFTSFPGTKKYFHMSTLNIYSRNFVDNHLPIDKYYEEFMGFGWHGAPGTPFEPYFALSLMEKRGLVTEQDVLDYIERHSYPLSYDRIHDPLGCAEPDDLTPDRYMKYGIVNCPNARGSTGATQPDIWKKVLRFVELYDPLKYDF